MNKPLISNISKTVKGIFLKLCMVLCFDPRMWKIQKFDDLDKSNMAANVNKTVLTAFSKTNSLNGHLAAILDILILPILTGKVPPSVFYRCVHFIQNWCTHFQVIAKHRQFKHLQWRPYWIYVGQRIYDFLHSYIKS